MNKIKINKKEIDSLDSKLNELYKNDITLNCVKQYEEDRKKLLALNSGDTISSELENLKKSLSNINIKNAFPSNEAYIKYSESILNTVDTCDYDTLQELISEPFRPHLRNEYKQVLKAIEIFLASSKKVINLALSEQSYYDKLNESIEKYQTDKLEASQGLLALASEINSDLFKTKLDLGLAYGDLATSARLGKTFEELAGNLPKFDLEKDSLSKIAGLGKTSILNTPITESYTSKISELAGLGSSLRENADNLSLQNKLFEETKINMFNIKPNLNMNEPNKYLRPLKIKNNLNKKLILKFEKQIEIIQEMSEYLVASGENQEIHANNLLEQNNNLIINSHKQIDLMANISSFLATQSEILNIQRENQEIQNEELKKQNNTMEKQVEENKSSSKIAFWTAISSILFGTGISIWIYFAEDISDTENHEDMKKVIQHNNNEVQLEKLIQQLTIQNENLKSMNEQLIIQNKNLDFIKKDISKENK